jgi:glycosyltransferase involved in cell wall biosynthesis
MSLRVVHLTSVHGTFDVRIFHKECVSLVSAGFDVTLIAPGEEDCEVQGVRVHVLKKRTGRLPRMLLGAWDVYRRAMAEDGDVYHFHDPELLMVAPMLRMSGKKVIYDSHESLPRQIMAKPWIPKFLRPLVSFAVSGVERMLAACCNAVVVTAPTIGERFPKSKVWQVCNFPGIADFNPAVKDHGSTPYVVYVGGLTRERGVRELVEAVGKVPEKYGLRLKLAGKFNDPSYQESLKSLPGWERTDYLGWLSREQIGELVSGARMGAVVLYPTPNHIVVYPMKLFEYMAAGIPSIISDFPVWREIVSSARCGVWVDPHDVDALALAIQRLLDNPEEAMEMGRSGRRAAEEKYTWAHEATTLVKLYHTFEGRDSAAAATRASSTSGGMY